MKPNVARILEAINKLDADVIALQEVGMPECLGESGRWSAKDGELTPKKEGSPPDADDGASLVEAMPRQLFRQHRGRFGFRQDQGGRHCPPEASFRVGLLRGCLLASVPK